MLALLPSLGRCLSTTGSANHLLGKGLLRNRYFGLRHGNSEANAAGIISSSPEVATQIHGLTELGMEQVCASAAALSSELGDGVRPLFYSSDFTRARMTAEKFSSLVGGEDPVLTTSLRERYFGDLDGGDDSRYGEVWEHDALSSSHTEFNVESVDSVIERTTLLVEALESEHNGDVIFLVAHGDVLQILQTAFLKVDGSTHRSLQHLDTASYREFILKT